MQGTAEEQFAEIAATARAEVLNDIDDILTDDDSVDYSVTFIERFVHSFIFFWLMSHEPMSLFSVACLTNSSSHTSLKLTKTGLSKTSLGPANFP